MAMFRRLRALLRRDAIADEIREEMEFHLEMRIDELQRRGLSRADAERTVHRKFGNVARLRDEGYDVRGAGFVESVWQDVRHSARLLRSKPVFAMTVIATLALGMGLIASLAAIVDAALVRPLPFVDPDRLVKIELLVKPDGIEEFSIDPSTHDIAALQQASPALIAMGGYHELEDRLVYDDGEPERLSSLTATPGYFEAHGAVPVVGRTFTNDDGRSGAEPVVMLGYAFWRQRFGGTADVVGRRANIEGRMSTIVGVAPRDFHRRTHLWRPRPSHGALAAQRATGTTVVAQMRSGVRPDELAIALTEAARRLPSADPFGSVAGVSVTPVYADLVERTSDALWLIGAGVLLLLMLVAVNVSGLVFAEGASRQQEFAVRSSLGAGRGRLIRQFITDATMLTVVASGVGLLVAAVSMAPLLAVLPLDLPPHAEPRVDARVVVITMLVGLIAAWTVALVPARRLTGFNLREWLDGRIPDVRSRWFSRPGQLIVCVQVTLVVVLLAGGGLLVRSLDRLMNVDLGFDPEAVHVLEVMPLDSSPAVWKDYYPALVQQLRRVRGVEAVGASDWMPLAEVMVVMAVDPAGGPDLSPAGVTPGLLEALGVRVRGGRLFAASDDGLPVAVITESAAREVFNSTDVVGKAVDLGQPHTVIGVVSDLRGWGPDSDPQNLVFTPLQATSLMPPTVVLRTNGPAPSLADLRGAATSIGPRVVVERVRPGTALLDENIEAPRQRSAVLALLALFGLVLTLVGIGGVTAQAVLRRTREIGVRMAFGATPQQVVRTVAGDSLKPALIGLTLGVNAAFYTTGILERYLFETTPTDPLTLSMVCVGVVVMATVAAWLPARRAARIDPVTALRE